MTGSPVYVDAARLPQTWRDVVQPPTDVRARAHRYLRDLDDGSLGPRQLAQFVERFADDHAAWSDLVVVDPVRRRYRLAYEDERLDLWVLSWMPGQATGFHDHGASTVAISTVQGVVLERHPSIGSHPRERELTPGYVHVGGAGYVHAVGHHVGEPAVTIHAYSPPLVEVGQYRATAEGRVWREVQHGRQELIDHTIDRHLPR